MKKQNLKYYIGIFSIMIIDSLHYVFFNDDSKHDIYFLYNHKRYLTNILYDISNLFKFTVLTYFLSSYNRIVFQPLFFLSLTVWILYFVNYNQSGGVILIPIYLLFVVLFKIKN